MLVALLELRVPNNTPYLMRTLLVMRLSRVVCPMVSMRASAQQDNHELQLDWLLGDVCEHGFFGHSALALSSPGVSLRAPTGKATDRPVQVPKSFLDVASLSAFLQSSGGGAPGAFGVAPNTAAPLPELLAFESRGFGHVVFTGRKVAGSTVKSATLLRLGCGCCGATVVSAAACSTSK